MLDMSATIVPRSDQLNADDLIAGPRTITITAVRGDASSKEQPVSFHYEGDNGRPYKPCKSMRRVAVALWGADASKYVGRSMTLYCDSEVQFGGAKVGGIRISHMSHIEGPQTIALTATRAKRAPFTVQPLAVAPTVAEYAACADSATLAQLEARRAKAWSTMSPADKKAVKAAVDAATARVRTAAPTPATSDAALPTEAELRAAKDQPALDALWSAVGKHYAGAEIPLALEAAYDEMSAKFTEG